jgi:carbamoyl-phosphate synthase large subunit
LPTLGGQTSLNLAVELAESGILDQQGVELIGAKLETIQMAEDRDLFRNAMQDIGLNVPPGDCVHTRKDAETLAGEIGFPLIIRPAFTLGGIGGSVVYNQEEFTQAAQWGLSSSPVSEILIEQSVLGFVIVCSIENFDPMGIHTGDSITVAPAQTLTDVEFQAMRDAAKKIVTKVGVETGGANIQFALPGSPPNLL